MKHRDPLRARLVDPVAPRAGAWIETMSLPSELDCCWSPPARGRGLKQPERCVCQLDLAHFDHLIWPTL